LDKMAKITQPSTADGNCNSDNFNISTFIFYIVRCTQTLVMRLQLLDMWNCLGMAFDSDYPSIFSFTTFLLLNFTILKKKNISLINIKQLSMFCLDCHYTLERGEIFKITFFIKFRSKFHSFGVRSAFVRHTSLISYF
jgi:hypothetical protein